MSVPNPPRHWSDRIGDGIDKADGIANKVYLLLLTILGASYLAALIRSSWRQ